MKLQFKHQKFQADAAKAVVDVFAGQPYLTPTYMMDRGTGYYQQSLTEEEDFTGWSNQKIVPERSDTATEGYVYLQGINLSKSAPTATIQFDCKTKSGAPKKVTRIVGEHYNLYDDSGELEEYKNGFVVKHIDGRDDSVEFLNGIKIYAGDVIGKMFFIDDTFTC